ncbi:MAG: sulfocyanin-like copper-binding protein [Acidimicrobiia bacterium]
MRRLCLVFAGSLVVVLASCGGTSATTGDVTALNSTLTDDAITIRPETAAAGRVSVLISNEGSLVHEFEVFTGSSTDLPVAKGVADTSGMTLIDEVEDITPGASPTLDLDLDPGSYVIICNLPGHYEMGMVAKLTVTR